MQEQRLDTAHLIYESVLQEAHEVSQRCLERLHDLNSRFECPDPKELEKVEANWTDDSVPPGLGILSLKTVEIQLGSVLGT